MLNERLKNISDPEIVGVIEELSQVTGLTAAGHAEFTLLNFLMLCRRNIWSDKRQRIDAANFYTGSMLKTKVQKLPPSIRGLVEALCINFKISSQTIETKTLYVFINDILNPNSKIRRKPPLFL